MALPTHEGGFSRQEPPKRAQEEVQELSLPEIHFPQTRDSAPTTSRESSATNDPATLDEVGGQDFLASLLDDNEEAGTPENDDISWNEINDFLANKNPKQSSAETLPKPEPIGNLPPFEGNWDSIDWGDEDNLSKPQEDEQTSLPGITDQEEGSPLDDTVGWENVDATPAPRGDEPKGLSGWEIPEEGFEEPPEEAPEDAEEEEPVDPQEDESESEPEEEGKERKKPKKRPSRFGDFSRSLLRTLGSIPFLGAIFRPLQGVASLVIFLFGLIPLVLIVILFLWIIGLQVPGSTETTGPDSSSAVFTNFSYDNGVVSGTIKNQGDVIAYVTPTVSIWVYNPFGGGSPFAYEAAGSCTGDELAVDIDSTMDFTLKCAPTSNGLFTKATGTLEF